MIAAPDMAAILRGPHIKSLIDDGGTPLVIIEPLRIVSYATHQNAHQHPLAGERGPAVPTSSAAGSTISGARI